MTFVAPPQSHVGFDQLNSLMPKLVAARVFHPHMQQTNKEEMGVYCQLGRIVRGM
jgi:hypothetical protein